MPPKQVFRCPYGAIEPRLFGVELLFNLSVSNGPYAQFSYVSSMVLGPEYVPHCKTSELLPAIVIF